LEAKDQKIALLSKQDKDSKKAIKVDPKPTPKVAKDSSKIEPKLEKTKKHSLLYRIFHKKSKR